jgi:hypothetical protein
LPANPTALIVKVPDDTLARRDKPLAFEKLRLGWAGIKGDLRSTGYFLDGKRVGWWKYYNPDGSSDMNNSGYYENDILVKPLDYELEDGYIWIAFGVILIVCNGLLVWRHLGE